MFIQRFRFCRKPDDELLLCLQRSDLLQNIGILNELKRQRVRFLLDFLLSNHSRTIVSHSSRFNDELAFSESA
ncbi:hypothetical protein D3C87_2017070 [compost metagenome]